MCRHVTRLSVFKVTYPFSIPRGFARLRVILPSFSTFCALRAPFSIYVRPAGAVFREFPLCALRARNFIVLWGPLRGPPWGAPPVPPHCPHAIPDTVRLSAGSAGSHPKGAPLLQNDHRGPLDPPLFDFGPKTAPLG